MTTPSISPALQLGVAFQAALRGISLPEVVKTAAALDHLESMEAESLGRFCASAACQAFTKAGISLSDSTHAQFEVLRKSAGWSPLHQRAAVFPFLRALSDTHQQVARMEKHSADGAFSAVAEVIGPILQAGAKLTPAMARTLFGLAALGGAGTGIATWHAQRDASQDSTETDVQRAKSDYYRMLTQNLKQHAKPFGTA